VAHFTTTDGVRIYYESHGTGDPLLLAYGIGGNAGMWRPNVHALASRHRLILWEPRGHARSESPADPTRVTFGHWVLDLKDLLDHLRLTHAVVGGLSLGGGIAANGDLLLDPVGRVLAEWLPFPPRVSRRGCCSRTSGSPGSRRRAAACRSRPRGS
jgi:pimeloyl-ACP methyl ester carboxylesterase